MERILRSSPFTASESYYEDGAVVDPGTVTIGITRADGTVLVAGGTATLGSGAAARTFNLTTTHTALTDTLTLTWTSAAKGIRYSTIEIAGGFLFSIVEARAVSPLGNETNFSTAAIVAMRTLVEQALEDACAVAFVPRYTRETMNGTGMTGLLTRWPKITALRSASIDGTALSAGELATVKPTTIGLDFPTGWTAGFSNVIVGYEHGHPVPPERVKRAALRLAKRWLVEGPVDERATSFSNDDGTYSLVTPGLRGVLFDLPEVNAVVQQYSLNVSIA